MPSGACGEVQSARTAAGSEASRSARCLMPQSILRSITSEPGSIAAMPIRSPSDGARIAILFRLRSLVLPPMSSSANAHTQVPSSDRETSARSGSSTSTRMPGRLALPRITSPTARFCHSGWIVSALRISSPNRFSIQS